MESEYLQLKRVWKITTRKYRSVAFRGAEQWAPTWDTEGRGDGKRKRTLAFCSYLRNIFNITAAGRLAPVPLAAVPYHISGVLHVRGLNLFCGAFFSVTCHGCRGVRERGKRKRSLSLSRPCSLRQKLVACKPPPPPPPTLPLPTPLPPSKSIKF